MRTLFLLLPCSFVALSAGELRPRSVEHVVVYQEEGRFGGWPANHGAWSWDDEIVVGFGSRVTVLRALRAQTQSPTAR